MSSNVDRCDAESKVNKNDCVSTLDRYLTPNDVFGGTPGLVLLKSFACDTDSWDNRSTNAGISDQTRERQMMNHERNS